MQPFEYGGSMIKTVSWHDSEWANLPDKFEAGTPNIAEAIGLKAAVEYLQKIGLQNIREHEKELTGYALKRMQEIKGLKLFCPMNPEKQGGIVLFDTAGIEAHDIALALDESANIAIRSGMHCAEPIVSSLNPKGLCRASFYFYNTKKEIDVFCDTLAELMKAFT
jgi:cysteine desulfurase/selenocysteine lyase